MVPGAFVLSNGKIARIWAPLTPSRRDNQSTRETPVTPMSSRIAALFLSLAGLSLAALPAMAAKDVKRDLSKDFDDLTPSEQIAIRAAAKAATSRRS